LFQSRKVLNLRLYIFKEFLAVNTPEKKKKTTAESFSETLRELLPYTNLGWQLVASMLLFFGAGYGADILLESSPWLTIILSVIGIVYGLTSVIKTANHLQQRNTRDKS
jgi:ATP synthase protein I